MTIKKMLHLIGSILLFFGLMMAFLSDKNQSELMGETNLGVAVLAPDLNSPEWKEKVHKRKVVSNLFYSGLVLTSIGIILQTIPIFINEKEKQKKVFIIKRLKK